MAVYLWHIIFMVNRLGREYIHLDSMKEAVHGELIGKAVRDIMRLSSGLEYLGYVLVCTVVFERRCFTYISIQIFYHNGYIY